MIHSSSGCLVAYFFSLHMFVDFAGFFPCSLFHSVVVGKMFDVISIFLNLLRLALWPRMWSILENVPCVLEKNVYSVALYRKLYKYQLSPFGLMCHVWPMLPYWFSVWMIFFIDVSGVLKSPTIIVLLSISPFISVNICLLYWVCISFLFLAASTVYGSSQARDQIQATVAAYTTAAALLDP